MCWLLGFEHKWNCCKETNKAGTVLPCRTACEATRDCQDPTSICRESVWSPMADGMITSQCAKCNNLGYYQLSSRPPRGLSYRGPYGLSSLFMRKPSCSTTDYGPFNPGLKSRRHASRSTHIEEPTKGCPSCLDLERRVLAAMLRIEARFEELERAPEGGEGGKPSQ